jgi:hypothetical protein
MLNGSRRQLAERSPPVRAGILRSPVDQEAGSAPRACLSKVERRDHVEVDGVEVEEAGESQDWCGCSHWRNIPNVDATRLRTLSTLNSLLKSWTCPRKHSLWSRNLETSERSPSRTTDERVHAKTSPQVEVGWMAQGSLPYRTRTCVVLGYSCGLLRRRPTFSWRSQVGGSPEYPVLAA